MRIAPFGFILRGPVQRTKPIRPALARKRKRIIIVAVIVSLLALAAWAAARPLAWLVVEHAIRTKFPEVRQLSTESLAAWMQEPSRPALHLLDARTPAEYAVSHLPNARQVNFDGDLVAQLAGIPKAEPLVVYCSVGYRSSMLARRLQSAGFRNVQNLEGSIFRWINEGRPLANGARKVHPYNSTWGLLVKPEARANLPDPQLPPQPPAADR